MTIIAPVMETIVPRILAWLVELLHASFSILKTVANRKVKAGIRLLMAEARVGEPYSIPLYPNNRLALPINPRRRSWPMILEFSGGNTVLLWSKGEGRRIREARAYE
uniref:Uncharacterized protein n=1 Tax=Opuntia streptacantha TaxID=393608 RepID=A0A7C8YCZ6_OPUST